MFTKRNLSHVVSLQKAFVDKYIKTNFRNRYHTESLGMRFYSEL